MFAGSYQVQILSLDLIHHGIHLREAHHAGHHIAADHERRHAVGESPVNHKIAGIGDHSGMNPGNIPHQIIKSVSGHFPGAVQIQSVEGLHDFRVVRNLEIGNLRLAETLHLHILAVVLSDGNLRVNHIGNHHHDFPDLFFHFLFPGSQLIDAGAGFRHLAFDFLGLFLLTLAHQRADLFGKLILIGTQRFYFLLDVSVFFLQPDDLIHQLQLVILEFFSDVFLHSIGIFSDKPDI